MSLISYGNARTTRQEEIVLLERSIGSLDRYVRGERFSGHDPYDALLSPLLRSLPGRLPKVAATQLLVYSPFDLRRAFKVEKGRNPKALALFLSAYSDMLRSGLLTRSTFDAVSTDLIGWLHSSQSVGYRGQCWGFNFPWQDVTRYSEPGLPTVVVSSFVGNSFLDVHGITHDPSHLLTAQGVCDFILGDLNVLEDEDGICFSYTPIDHHAVHNASAMGAALLARMHSLTGRQDHLDVAVKAIDHLLAHQEKDGSWAYSYDPRTGRKRRQIDFHHGFVLNSLADFIKYSGTKRQGDIDALLRGAEFYRREQFDPTGRSLWRLPWERPADIHHQAQGILTFTKLSAFDPDLLPFACKVARWTVQNMQDPSGYFIYQRYGALGNRIPYMRWGQAWMMHALARLLWTLRSNPDAGDR